MRRLVGYGVCHTGNVFARCWKTQRDASSLGNGKEGLELWYQGGKSAMIHSIYWGSWA